MDNKITQIDVGWREKPPFHPFVLNNEGIETNVCVEGIFFEGFL